MMLHFEKKFVVVAAQFVFFFSCVADQPKPNLPVDELTILFLFFL